ncbi:MAG: hypothetical protein ACRDKE_04995, partial [Solirubrobacterales bacterium]
MSRITSDQSNPDPEEFIMRLFSRLALTSALVLAAGSGMAATISFTGATGSLIAAGNDDTVVYSGNAAFGDVTVSAEHAGSDLTYSAGNGLGVDCSGYSLACLVDNRNQVDNGEVLTISFEQPLFVTSVDVGNLLGTHIGLGRFSFNIEEGGSLVASNFEIGFDSSDASGNGTLNLAVNRWASSISFVPNSGYLNAFSVAGVSIDELARPISSPGTN